MPNTSQRRFRRFAPAVLSLSVLFLGVSDAGAQCLAAWLCPQRAAEECADSHGGPLAWTADSGACSFEARLDRPSPSPDRVKLDISAHGAPAFATPADRHSFAELQALPPLRADRRSPPLYRLTSSLLI